MKPCVVLPGLQGLLVQLLLFGCCVGTLVAKKVCEGERTWFQFGLDSSKQFIGAGWVHVLNLLCAEILGSQMGDGDECEWYWLNIMLDTTLGVLVEYLLLRVVADALNNLLESAEAIMYAKQLGMWLTIVTFMKLFMVVLMVLLAKPLTLAARECLKPFMNPLLKLLVVMIVTPAVMNAFQLWVTDNFLKLGREDEVFARDHHVQQEVPVVVKRKLASSNAFWCQMVLKSQWEILFLNLEYWI
ncbi:unnamed protein product [Durusdinium trenchii]|uniref:Uncharacterized protein n=1 Tax=Durusdinium trenchii TaxID=1381693 RepID=A0ABP0S6C7_9DINO